MLCAVASVGVGRGRLRSRGWCRGGLSPRLRLLCGLIDIVSCTRDRQGTRSSSHVINTNKNDNDVRLDELRVQSASSTRPPPPPPHPYLRAQIAASAGSAMSWALRPSSRAAIEYLLPAVPPPLQRGKTTTSRPFVRRDERVGRACGAAFDGSSGRVRHRTLCLCPRIPLGVP